MQTYDIERVITHYPLGKNSITVSNDELRISSLCKYPSASNLEPRTSNLAPFFAQKEVNEDK